MSIFGTVSQFFREEPKPEPKVFRPTFHSPVGYGPNGYVNKYMNPHYFATESTAAEMMRRYHAREMYERIAPGNEGPLYTCSHLQWWLRWPDGLELCAGTLAAFYDRNPEDLFPGVADRLVSEHIVRARYEKALEEKARG